MKRSTLKELQDVAEHWRVHAAEGARLHARREAAARKALAEGATQTAVAAELGFTRQALADLLRRRSHV